MVYEVSCKRKRLTTTHGGKKIYTQHKSAHDTFGLRLGALQS